MQLIAIVILGAVLGFTYGYNNSGFIFSTDICLFAGLTLIMPSLFNFKFTDIKLVWNFKEVLFKGFLVNYVMLPLFALIIGLVTKDFGIASGLFLVSVLSGGGMVMHWIKKSGGDTSLGFLLLFINLVFISFSFLLLDIFAKNTVGYFDVTFDEEISLQKYVSPVITLLIAIPFLASRVVIFIEPLKNLIKKYQKYISHISIFIILFYLFGLQDSQLLIDVYDFYPENFFTSIIAVVVFYALTTVLSLKVYDLESKQEKAAFWHSVTRYLTLALVISTFSMDSFGVSMVLPIMFSYLVQIPLSVFLAKKYFSDNE